jgi:uncharacterized membrane protein YidH (DUF202 family)
MKETVNKDLILRERLALQRTILANQTTVLAFFRTAMYFFVAGLSTRNLLKIEKQHSNRSIVLSYCIRYFNSGHCKFLQATQGDY